MAISLVSVGQKITASFINSIINVVNAAPTSRRNFLLNSNFEVQQRAFPYVTGAVFFSDRWRVHATVTGATVNTITTGIPATFGSKYAAGVVTSSSSNSATFGQALPSEEVARLKGQTVVFSAKMYSSVACSVTMKIQTSTTADADASASWTDLVSTTQSVTTTATVFSTASATIPTSAAGVRVQFSTSNIGSATTLVVGLTQLEIGSTASTWNLQTGNYANELAACQRYYFRYTSTTQSNFGTGSGASTVIGLFVVKFPVTMRAQPTSLDYITLRVHDGVTQVLPTSVAIDASGSGLDHAQITVTFSVATLTVYRFYYLGASTSGGYFGLSAELA